jgi:ABC-type lipopolysaccharide export system ATPase subunit
MAKSPAVPTATKGRVVKAVPKGDGTATTAAPAPKKPINPAQFIREVRAEGLMVLMVEQNALAALELCDRAYLLETGRVVREGDGRSLLASDDVRKAYLGGRAHAA